MITKWKLSNGTEQEVTSMATTHLFYTMRLLWNSLMPRPLSVGTGKTANFNSAMYTSDYLWHIINVMYEELRYRKHDLPHRYQEQLAQMQIDKLLVRVSTDEALAESLADYLAREEFDYEPETKHWNTQPGVQL